MEGPIIDWNYLTKHIGFKKEQAIDLFPLFIQALDDEIPKLQQACEEKDQTTISSLAHKLKGSSLCCGALRLKEICQQLETCFEEGKENQLASFCQQLLAESQLVKKEMLALLNNS